MDYEELLREALEENLMVRELPLQASDGRIKGDRIAIRKDIETSVEKACVLAEELGHHHTTVGNILAQETPQNRKQERQARFWAYEKAIGLDGLIEAYEHGCRSWHDTAEFLEVTEEFLIDAVEAYRQKYGVGVRSGKYYVSFEPELWVMKKV